MIKAEQILAGIAAKAGMKISIRDGKITLSDDSGEKITATTNEQAAEVLYDEIFCNGIYSGKREAVEEIINHARLL